MIEAKVAAILNPTTVVLSAGTDQGVEDNAIATVLKDVDIRDPEDRFRSLGTIRQARLKLRVYHVQDKLCVATTFEQVQRGGGTAPDFYGSFGALLGLETQRVTEDPKAVDYRTVLVAIGAPVTIDNPSAENDED